MLLEKIFLPLPGHQLCLPRTTISAGEQDANEIVASRRTPKDRAAPRICTTKGAPRLANANFLGHLSRNTHPLAAAP